MLFLFSHSPAGFTIKDLQLLIKDKSEKYGKWQEFLEVMVDDVENDLIDKEALENIEGGNGSMS